MLQRIVEPQVGNYPGRALSFAASLGGGGNGSGAEPRLLSLPGKREGLFATGGVPHLIARSDSNGESPTYAWADLWCCCAALCCAAVPHVAAHFSMQRRRWLPAASMVPSCCCG